MLKQQIKCWVIQPGIFNSSEEASSRAAADPLRYDFAQRGPPITRGCLEPLCEMKALFVLVRSSSMEFLAECK